MANNEKFTFISSLFFINRKDRNLVFVIQAIIGAFNLILFFAFVTSLIIFRNNLRYYVAMIFYFLYVFYVIVNWAFSLTFYFYLNSLLNEQEKKYFMASLIQGVFGINLFTSIYFYFKSGLSNIQKQKAISIIKRNRIHEIIDLNNKNKNLTKKELLKIETLFKIAKNKHEDIDNINGYILEMLISKNIPTNIVITDEEIIKLGHYL